jgi:hypothetical protein
MRLPKFTAEASLYKKSVEYAGFSTSASRLGAGLVTAQFLFGGQEWWGGWWFNHCPVGCWLGTDGHCHCYRAYA